MNDNVRYGYSRLTDTWYRVYAWKNLGNGKIQAKSKEEVSRDEVPQEWIDGVDERPYDTEVQP